LQQNKDYQYWGFQKERLNVGEDRIFHGRTSETGETVEPVNDSDEGSVNRIWSSGSGVMLVCYAQGMGVGRETGHKEKPVIILRRTHPL
jgi:hypothetical protein